MSRKKLALVPLFVSAILSLALFSLSFASSLSSDNASANSPDRNDDLLVATDAFEIPGATIRPLAAPDMMLPMGAIMMYEIEPNNTYTTANPLPGNQAVVSGNIYPAGDLDYFSFSGSAGDRVYAATMTSFAAGSTDSTLTLFDTDGTTIIEVDVNDGSFAASSSSIAGATLPANGTYYLQVRATSATSSMRPYHLYFKLQSGAPTPETEPNNLADGGQPLPPSAWVSGAINPAGDNDVFTFALNAGDTVYLSLDLDPERDGGTTWNGRLGLGAFGNPPLILVVNDPSTTSPNSEAFFFTVKEAGTYYAYVDPATAGTGDPAWTYHLSVTVFPHVPATASCTTYTSTDVPLVIPTGPALVESTLMVPGNPIIADIDVSIMLTHTNMPDLDVVLLAPGGNQVVLFNDLGVSTQQQMNLTLDDEAAIPMGSYTVMSGMVYQPPASRRLDWFDHQNAGGTWTLQVYDDLANNGGVLQAWSLTICEPPPPPSCPVGYEPVTVFSTDFEADDGGFTSSGVQNEWQWGVPNFAPITTCSSGANCWVTDLTGTYNASSNQDLFAPAIDLSGYSGPVIMRWAQKHQIENANWDNAFVDVQEVGGANPTRLWEWLGPTMSNQTVGSPTVTIPQSAGWSQRWADISAYAGQSIEARFNLSSDSSINFAGLAIDDFSVIACQPESGGPAISLTKTVGTDAGVCAVTDSITIPAGVDVTYCYTVENTGDETLNLHDLVDSELGSILSGFPFALTPGASVFLTQTTFISATTVNTALWTAYNVGPTDVVTATAAATVTVAIVDPPNIFVDPLALASSQEPDTQTQHTVTISNTGGSNLIWEILEEPVIRATAQPLFPATLPFFDAQAALAAEMAGLETDFSSLSLQPIPEARALAKRALMTTGILLIPDSLADRIMAFDPITGNLLDANFIPSNPIVGTGIHAILSASGDTILLSDQIGDVVHEFDLDGNYLGIFAPAGGANTAILDNIRGIRLDADGTLLVTVASGANTNSIARFDTSGNYLGNFVANGAGGLSSPWDIFPRTTDWLVSASGSSAIHRYDLTGAYIANLTAVSTFPEQMDIAANGNVLVANFSPSANQGVLEYTPTGDFVGRYAPAGVAGNRGVYELPNGNMLTTTGSGVFEISRANALVDTKITSVSARFISYVVAETGCSNPANIPWASVAPANGTTAPGAAADVTVTLDSTGLMPGDYSGNLCFFSNDPDPGPGNETELVVVPVSLTVLQTQFASIELTKTVGTDPGVCASTDEITVDGGDVVYYCYEVSNTGDVPLPLHDLVDDQLGTIFAGLSYNLLPGESVNTVAAGLTISQTIYLTTTNTAVWTAYDGSAFTAAATAAATVNVNLPAIGVSPASLSSSQLAGTVRTETLTISNSGSAVLNWEIEEAGSLTAAGTPESILYDNGPLVTHPGGGAGGADASRLQNTSLGMTTFGFGNQFAVGNRMADDFTVPDSGWILDSVTIYSYQTGSSTASTITGLYVQIWDGPPNDPGSSVIFGDLTTNRMLSTGWTNVYRTTETAVTDSTRPIMTSVADLGGLHLPAGSYWFDWMVNGSLASGPWAPPITILGQTTTGNALQFTGAWAAAIDTGSGTQQGMPFTIAGSVASPCTSPEDIGWLSVDPVSGSTAVGGSSEVTVSFDSTGLVPGDYQATLCVYSNDPAQPLVEVPVALTVQPSAYLQVSHLAPFAADTSVTVLVNGVPALTDFVYGDAIGYIELPAGEYDIDIVPTGATDPAISATVNLAGDTYYSAIAYGDGPNQALGLMLLADDNTAPAAGKFHLRLGHLAPFAAGPATADIRLQDGTLVVGNVDFGDVTGYIELDAGTYDLKITTPGGAVTLIDPLPITFSEGDIVTAFATGDGSDQPLGVFAWPKNTAGFFLPLAPTVFNLYLPIIVR
jgi:subtilisin-like proprotein convertase family protein